MRSRRPYVALVTLVAATALAAVPTQASAAGVEVQPAEETLEVILVHNRPGSRPDLYLGTHALTLGIYPLRGIAVVTTASNNFDIENNTSAVYAERIPVGPFDGHLDLRFKGLGSFVADFVPSEPGKRRSQKGCTGPRSTSQLGELRGTIDFHGRGYAKWTAPRAVAFLSHTPRLRCRHGAAKRARPPKSLFGYVSGGYGSFSGWRYALRARLRRPHRFSELAVFGYERKGPVVNFDAATYEYLPGGIAAGRFVKRSVRGGALLEASAGGYHPEHALLRPPAPYSGIGTYSRATHRLTGSMAVQFPGLRIRLGGPRTVANLVDEAGLSERSPNEPLGRAR
jgi:hypothetical protein